MQIRITSYDTPPVKFTLAGTYKEGHDKLAIHATRGIQRVGFLRASHKTNRDHGNAELTVNFSTARTFSTTEEAEAYAADLDEKVPPLGKVELLIMKNGQLSKTRTMEYAAVSVIQASFTGVTVEVSFTIFGAEISARNVGRA